MTESGCFVIKLKLKTKHPSLMFHVHEPQLELDINFQNTQKIASIPFWPLIKKYTKIHKK